MGVEKSFCHPEVFRMLRLVAISVPLEWIILSLIILQVLALLAMQQ